MISNRACAVTTTLAVFICGAAALGRRQSLGLQLLAMNDADLWAHDEGGHQSESQNDNGYYRNMPNEHGQLGDVGAKQGREGIFDKDVGMKSSYRDGGALMDRNDLSHAMAGNNRAKEDFGSRVERPGSDSDWGADHSHLFSAHRQTDVWDHPPPSHQGRDPWKTAPKARPKPQHSFSSFSHAKKKVDWFKDMGKFSKELQQAKQEENSFGSVVQRMKKLSMKKMNNLAQKAEAYAAKKYHVPTGTPLATKNPASTPAPGTVAPSAPSGPPSPPRWTLAPVQRHAPTHFLGRTGAPLSPAPTPDPTTAAPTTAVPSSSWLRRCLRMADRKFCASLKPPSTTVPATPTQKPTANGVAARPKLQSAAASEGGTVLDLRTLGYEH